MALSRPADIRYAVKLFSVSVPSATASRSSCRFSAHFADNGRERLSSPVDLQSEIRGEGIDLIVPRTNCKLLAERGERRISASVA
jgi:hypothetical protein